MARIGVTLSGAERMLLNRLAEADAAATLHTLRLATGKRILSPADGPSTFVTLSRFQDQLNRVTAAMANVTTANSMISQAQTTLDQIRTQLDTIRTELLQDEGRSLSQAERDEAQAEIDAAIDEINLLAGTEIDGRRLLDGSADYQVSGRVSSQVAEVTVYSTVGGSSPTITGQVLQAATQARLVYTGVSGEIDENATFTLTGLRGSNSLTVTSGTDLDVVAEEINDASHQTGITAEVAGDELTLTSVDYGTRAMAAVAVTDGTFDVTGGTDGTDYGTDAEVVINGQTLSSSRVDGNNVSFNDNGFRFRLRVTAGYAGQISTITVSGDALRFALSTKLDHASTLAVPAMHAERLGGLSGTLDQLQSGGSLAGLDDNTSQAIRVVDEALGQLTRVEGSVDGFYNASVTTSSELLSDLETDLEDAIDETDGYDENEETLLLNRAQELAANATAGLSILNQQRAGVVQLIQQIAGLI